MEYRACHLRQLPQRSDRKEICRHQKGKDASIVGWPKSGGNQTNRLHRISESLFAESFGGGGRRALKMVGSESVLSLLFAHGTDHDTHRITPLAHRMAAFRQSVSSIHATAG